MTVVYITTPRPPLNLFEGVRSTLSTEWTIEYPVPFYRIPANGPTPARTVTAAAILTGLVLTPLSTSVRVSLRVADPEDRTFLLLDGAHVPANDFLSVSLDRMVLLSGECLQGKVEGGGCVAHLSLILNTREDYELINA